MCRAVQYIVNPHTQGSLIRFVCVSVNNVVFVAQEWYNCFIYELDFVFSNTEFFIMYTSKNIMC